jgi:dihydrodipicolinate synthase/N-acetylneuraminate lyase
VDLTGVYIPSVSPFEAGSGDLDLDAFGANLSSWSAHPISGIVVGGSTGEALLLDVDERRRSWETAREIMGSGLLLIAGTGAESTRGTIELTRLAAVSGADAVLVQPPAFYRGAMNPVALAAHYRAVADVSPVPVILYQVPLNLSTLDLPTELVAELSGHDNIVGIKDSRGVIGLVAELVEATRGRDFQVLVGNGAVMCEALGIGAVGGILAVANLLPGDCAQIVRAFHEGRIDEAERLQARVAPLHRGIVGGMGVPGVKFALDLLGLRGGDPRPPLRPLAEARHEEVSALLAGCEAPV